MSRTPIEPSKIRKGDLIRREPVKRNSLKAVEYEAEYAGHMHGLVDSHTDRFFLLDRPAPAVELPTEPTLGWLNGNPHLLAIWQDCSETAVRPPAVRPVNVPTVFDGDHVKSFTPATAVPTEALNMLRAGCFMTVSEAAEVIAHFLAAVDRANGTVR